MKIRIYVFAVSLFFASALCIAEETQTIEQIVLQRSSDLASMNSSINYFASQIDAKNLELAKEHNENRKTKLESEISQLTIKLNAAKMSFANTIADVNLFSEEEDAAPSKPKEKDILKELQELLVPFIDSIKNATKSPRKIEKLRNDIAIIDLKDSQSEEALQNLTRIESLEQFKDMKENIEASKLMIQKVVAENKILKNIYKRDLDKALRGQTSFFVVADMIQGFFATKGKDLLIALCTGILAAFILKCLKKIILNLKYFNNSQRNIKKTFNAFYGIVSTAISVFSGIAALYLLNDWFLFSLALLILIAVFWSLKTYIPRFLTEIKIIMDLGYVKEGQRIVWNNCPWIVKKLGMSVQLENEYLDSRIRFLPIREISNLYSRPLVQDEPLFPSRKGDFVMLSDETYGKVLTQTSENVVLLLPPTVQITLPLQEYLSLKPRNYSNGFQVKTLLSIDYKHQKDVFQIEDIVKKELSELLQSNSFSPAENFKNLIVEFKEASNSSLDFFVWVDCKGELAPDYSKVCRFINSMILKICSKHSLSIPYPHMQVIMEK